MRDLLGHNGGPPLDLPTEPPESGGRYRLACWTLAHQHAWKSLSRDQMMMRLTRAERLGLTYREYMLEILERGRFLQDTDVDRIAAILARRGHAS